ncbi:MAG: hypothetical protein WBD71_17665, partial [Xanthobacteraceae bacterium]
LPVTPAKVAPKRAVSDFLLYDLRCPNQCGIGRYLRQKTKPMLGITRTVVKVLIASMIVGTILTHFGIGPEQLVKLTGLSPERLEDLARAGLAWALPNLLLGSLVIVPVWFLFYIFRPPGESRD